MRIDLSFGNLESLQSTTSKRLERGSAETRCANREDAATLSFCDARVSQLTAAALAAPEIRSERVAELRTSIDNGTYVVEPGAIATAMMNDLF